MEHLATELAHAHALQRRLDIVHLEARQRIRVAGSFVPPVHAERGVAARGLPAVALAAGPRSTSSKPGTPVQNRRAR